MDVFNCILTFTSGVLAAVLLGLVLRLWRGERDPISDFRIRQLAREEIFAVMAAHETLEDDPVLEELRSLNQGARPHFVRAMAAAKRQEYGAAAASFAAGLKLQPDNVNARVSYARALYLDGDAEAARRECQRQFTVPVKV